jgi:hypothetical protein
VTWFSQVIPAIGPGTEWVVPTTFGGLAVFMLIYFMKRDAGREARDTRREEAKDADWHKRMLGIENASNRSTRAILMLVMSLNKHPKDGPVREEVEKIEGEIHESERERARERGDELPDRR